MTTHQNWLKKQKDREDETKTERERKKEKAKEKQKEGRNDKWGEGRRVEEEGEAFTHIIVQLTSWVVHRHTQNTNETPPPGIEPGSSA